MEPTISKVKVISFGDGAYLYALDRLRESLIAFHPDWDIEFETSRPTGCPDQNASPMAFKPILFERARVKGYKIVLWLDSVCVLVRSAQRIVTTIEKRGAYLWTNYSATGEWCADATLHALGVSRNDSFSIPELTTCVVGLNFDHPKANAFLDEWLTLAKDGISFRGMPLDDRPWTDVVWNSNGCISEDPRVKGHRYDQTVASLLAEKHRLPRTGLGTFDIQQVIPSDRDPDRRIFVPRDVSILQNRDMKEGQGLRFRQHLEFLTMNERYAERAYWKRNLKQVLFESGVKRLW